VKQSWITSQAREDRLKGDRYTFRPARYCTFCPEHPSQLCGAACGNVFRPSFCYAPWNQTVMLDFLKHKHYQAVWLVGFAKPCSHHTEGFTHVDPVGI